MKKRHGLWESLESYATRNGVTIELARPYWRAWAFVLLFRDADSRDIDRLAASLALKNRLSACRPLPGVSIPTNGYPL